MMANVAVQSKLRFVVEYPPAPRADVEIVCDVEVFSDAASVMMFGTGRAVTWVCLLEPRDVPPSVRPMARMLVVPGRVALVERTGEVVVHINIGDGPWPLLRIGLFARVLVLVRIAVTLAAFLAGRFGLLGPSLRTTIRGHRVGRGCSAGFADIATRLISCGTDAGC